MKLLNRWFLAALGAAFFMVVPAQSQNTGSVNNHAVAVGKGAGKSGFTSVGPCTLNYPILGQGASADPACVSVLNALQAWGVEIPNLTHKASPSGSDKIMIYDVAGSAAKYSTLTELGTATAPANTVANGLTSTTNLIGFIHGLQPHKLSSGVIGLNPGTWANNTGTALYNVTSVITADLTTSTINFGTTPPTGGQVSGALSSGSTYNGTEITLYLGHRNSDSLPFFFTSSSDTQGASTTFTCTNASPGVFTTAVPHGLRKRMAVYFMAFGGNNCPPFGPSGTGVQYYVCTVPSATTFTLATSIPNVNSGSCTATTNTGSGSVKWGVQPDLDYSTGGSSTLTIDRRLPWFAGIWRDSWDYVPEFTNAQDEATSLLTGMNETTAFCSGAQNPGGSYVAYSLAPFLNNLNRHVLLHTICISNSSAGQCFLRGTSSSGNQVVGTVTAGGTSVAQDVWVPTDSLNNVDIAASSGVNINLCVKGWRFTDPS